MTEEINPHSGVNISLSKKMLRVFGTPVYVGLSYANEMSTEGINSNVGTTLGWDGKDISAQLKVYGGGLFNKKTDTVKIGISLRYENRVGKVDDIRGVIEGIGEIELKKGMSRERVRDYGNRLIDSIYNQMIDWTKRNGVGISPVRIVKMKRMKEGLKRYVGRIIERAYAEEVGGRE